MGGISILGVVRSCTKSVPLCILAPIGVLFMDTLDGTEGFFINLSGSGSFLFGLSFGEVLLSWYKLYVKINRRVFLLYNENQYDNNNEK